MVKTFPQVGCTPVQVSNLPIQGAIEAIDGWLRKAVNHGYPMGDKRLVAGPMPADQPVGTPRIRWETEGSCTSQLNTLKKDYR